MLNDNADEYPYNFDDFLLSIKAKDSFRTYGLMFESALEEKSRKSLIETTITEKRNGIRGISDEIFEGQNNFYAVGAFLKVLSELGFEVEETLDESWDFCGSMLLDEDQLQISVEFNYGEDVVEYEVMFCDEREHTGHTNATELLEGIFSGGWNLPKIANVLSPSSLYDDLETFMRDFRNAWDKYKKIVAQKL